MHPNDLRSLRVPVSDALAVLMEADKKDLIRLMKMIDKLLLARAHLIGARDEIKQLPFDKMSDFRMAVKDLDRASRLCLYSIQKLLGVGESLHD